LSKNEWLNPKVKKLTEGEFADAIKFQLAEFIDMNDVHVFTVSTAVLSKE